MADDAARWNFRPQKPMWLTKNSNNGFEKIGNLRYEFEVRPWEKLHLGLKTFRLQLHRQYFSWRRSKRNTLLFSSWRSDDAQWRPYVFHQKPKMQLLWVPHFVFGIFHISKALFKEKSEIIKILRPLESKSFAVESNWLVNCFSLGWRVDQKGVKFCSLSPCSFFLQHPARVSTF